MPLKAEGLGVDGTGLVVVYKRLDVGRFAWPAAKDGVMRLARAQFAACVRARLAAGDAAAGAAAGDGGVTPRR